MYAMSRKASEPVAVYYASIALLRLLSPAEGVRSMRNQNIELPFNIPHLRELPRFLSILFASVYSPLVFQGDEYTPRGQKKNGTLIQLIQANTSTVVAT